MDVAAIRRAASAARQALRKLRLGMDCEDPTGRCAGLCGLGEQGPVALRQRQYAEGRHMRMRCASARSSAAVPIGTSPQSRRWEPIRRLPLSLVVIPISK